MRCAYEPKCICVYITCTPTPTYFFPFPPPCFFPPLFIALISAFRAIRAFRFRQAANLSPGLKAFTLCAARLRSAAMPISQLAVRHWYPGRRVSVVSTHRPSRFVLMVLVRRSSWGCSRMIVATTAASSDWGSGEEGVKVERSPVVEAVVAGIW